jgi:hypothetical protein
MLLADVAKTGEKDRLPATLSAYVRGMDEQERWAQGVNAQLKRRLYGSKCIDLGQRSFKHQLPDPFRDRPCEKYLQIPLEFFEYCTTLPVWWLHHRGENAFDSLEESARKGCGLCDLLLKIHVAGKRTENTVPRPDCFQLNFHCGVSGYMTFALFQHDQYVHHDLGQVSFTVGSHRRPKEGASHLVPLIASPSL